MLTHSSYLSRLKRFIARYSGSRPVCSSLPAVGPAAETPAIAPARSSRVRALDSPRVPDSARTVSPTSAPRRAGFHVARPRARPPRKVATWKSGRKPWCE